MVSSAIGMSKAELVRALTRIRREHAADPEYKQLRKALPTTWPV
jgi:hypothetical protein